KQQVGRKEEKKKVGSTAAISRLPFAVSRLTIHDMLLHTQFTNNYKGKKELHALIAHGHITLAGNRVLKVYGTLSCGSGKRMKRTNRVFFANEQEALEHGYRPCGNCLKKRYKGNE